jgi:hypothetical protein
LTAAARWGHYALAMGEIVVTLPSASPEDYLRLVEWWRRASRSLFAAVRLGASPPDGRNQDPVLRLIDSDAPEKVEAEAQRALADGLATIAPIVRVDGDLAVQARDRGRRRLEWLVDMQEHGVPPLDPDLAPLLIASHVVGEEAIRAAGIDLH